MFDIFPGEGHTLLTPRRGPGQTAAEGPENTVTPLGNHLPVTSDMQKLSLVKARGESEGYSKEVKGGQILSALSR